jgi:hypothetical protein
MKTGDKSLLGKVSCVLSVAALTLAFSLDGLYAVSAEEPEAPTSSLQDLIVAPMVKTIEGLEQRLTNLEAAVGLTSRRIVAQTLCVSDESGAQTCITKAQLDALLSSVAHAEIRIPSTTVDSRTPAPVEPIETVTVSPAPSDVRDEIVPPSQDPEHTGALAATPTPTRGEAIEIVTPKDLVSPAQPEASDEVLPPNQDPEHTGALTATPDPAPVEPIEIVTTKDPVPSTQSKVSDEIFPTIQDPEHTGALAATLAPTEQKAPDAMDPADAESRLSASDGGAITQPSEKTAQILTAPDNIPSSETSNVSDEARQDDHHSVQTGTAVSASHGNPPDLVPDADIGMRTAVPIND